MLLAIIYYNLAKVEPIFSIDKGQKQYACTINAYYLLTVIKHAHNKQAILNIRALHIKPIKQIQGCYLYLLAKKENFKRIIDSCVVLPLDCYLCLWLRILQKP